jgi:hypothetical protein
MYVATSIFLWKYLGGVFIPSLLTRTILNALPVLMDFKTWVDINTNAFYFGLYFVVGAFWPRLKWHFRNPFLAAMALWLVNVLILFPVIGRGILGYRLPQGWMAVSLPLLVSHWLFARGLAYQTRS